MIIAIKLICVLHLLFALSHAQGDPCKDATIKRNEYRRSANYTAGMQGETDFICDRYLDNDWYIFEGYQGQEMPNYPPGLGQCGTGYPVWLDGDLPKEADGIVQRKACSQGLATPCYLQYDIEIKNCGDVYAYKLPPTAGSCPEAYCIGSELPCPIGESSETGFTPGCTNEGFPTFFKDPTITFRVDEKPTAGVTFRQVVVECNLDHNETNIFLDVVWYVGDVKVKENTGPNSLPYTDFPAELFEDDWQFEARLDNDVRCELRGRYEQDSVPGPMKFVEYYMGFVVENLFLEVEEGGDPDYYIVRPTIPVLCPVGIEVCKLALEVREPYIDGEAASCPDGRRLKQTAIEFRQTECKLDIPMVLEPDDTTTFSLPVRAASDSTYDGDHFVKLVVRSVENHQYHPIWQNYHLPQAEVFVIDKDVSIAGLTCEASDDPHMITFDGSKYDNMLEGEFVMYRHETLPIEIQTYFKAMGSYSRVCGAAVRSGGDLFIYDFCRDGAEARIRLYECEDLNMAITKSGNVINIELPHGTKVTLGPTYIIIVPCLSDLENIVGLCGKFDRVCGNDYVGGDGNQFPDPCNPNADCSNVGGCRGGRLHDFSETWRVPADESLYQGKINNHRPKPDTIYCSCVDVENDDDDVEHETLCQSSTDLEFCIAGGIGGDFENQCVERYKALSSNAGSDDVVDEVGPFEYDPNFNPPEPEWKDPWNEALATAECENFISSLQGINTCLTVPTISKQKVLERCVEDIKITADIQFHTVHADNILSNCLYEITKNMTYFTFNNDTGEVLPPYEMTKDICTVQCKNSGTCVEGKCQCAAGYFGEDCYFDEDYVPNLYAVPSGGVCDTQTRPCEQTPVTGHYFLEKETLTCHIEPVLLKTTGEKVPQGETTTKARFDHFERVMCPLPVVTINYNEDVFTVGYTVAVSNDGVSKSDKVQLVTYDSLCMNCTADLSCFQLENTCLIQSNCYSNGQLAPEDPCLKCDPSASASDWSKVLNSQCENNNNNAGLIAGITILVVAVAATAAVIGVVVVKNKKKANIAI